MKTRIAALRRHALVTALTVLVAAPAADPALAAPGTLSQVPLYVGPNVEPNVVFLNDDSGSMEFTIMAPEDGGAMWLSGRSYYYAHPTRSGSNYRGQTYTWACSNTTRCNSTSTSNGFYSVASLSGGQALVVPTEEALASRIGSSAAAATGVWRAWNHEYNTVYYNPAITYQPWRGVDINGAEYGNANPAAARLDPYDPGFGTENLTSNRTYTTTYPGQRNGGFDVTMYPARYYIWTDSNGNGEVDAADDRELVEVKPGNAPFAGGPDRSDCAAAPVCTYAEEIQNFANWYSYYRSRDLTAKGAATTAISDVTGIRVGYATINENSSARFRVQSMNDNPATGNKRSLFDRIFGASAQSNTPTPLRTSLSKTGRYFECASGNIMNASGSNCPLLPAAQGGMCQKNYTILMTDGYWNDTTSPDVGNADGDNNTAWDGGSYGDSRSNTLADVAMYYYERDLSTSLPNEVPPSPNSDDDAPHQHMTTFTVAFGVSGTLDPATDDPASGGFSWPNPANGDAEKIDDLWHAAYNGRGEFYSAQDPVSLAAGLRAAFASVSRGKSSSASVAFNTTRLNADSRLYQASFNPSDGWSGSLTAINLTLDGQLGSDVWDAGVQLNAISPDERLIFTWHEGERAGIPFREYDELSTRQKADLDTAPSGVKDGLGPERLAWLRGVRDNEGPGTDHEFRERSNVLGDIVYSNPVFVGRPQAGYDDDPSFGAEEYSLFANTNIDRPPVIYVGANDGMLHGFWANDGAGYSAGDEAIAYVPNMLFSDEKEAGLHYLTDPAYGHRFYVDLSPTVADVYVGGAWRTILIGGYRAGGRGLFALDVTRPQQFSEDAADDIVLWEFTSEDDANLGHTFSKPTIALLENDRWAAVFGNGYNDLGDGTAKLYVLYIEEGLDGTWSAGDFVVIDTKKGSTADRNGLSSPALLDLDGNGKADRAYAGDLHGNLWAFDLKNLSVAYAQGNTPHELFNGTAGTRQPITSKPIVARNPDVAAKSNNAPNLLVFFGTGQYLVNGDKSSTAVQTFYGVWDSGAKQLRRSNLVAQTLDANKSTANLRVTTDSSVNYNNRYGWYFDLPASGERVVVDPKVRGKYVFFNTMIPDPGNCNATGSGWLMALKIGNGGNPDDPVYDVNNDGEVDENDLLDGENRPSGVRLDNIPAGSNFLDHMMYTPDDEGNIDVRAVDAGVDFSQAGRRSWREVRP